MDGSLVFSIVKLNSENIIIQLINCKKSHTLNYVYYKVTCSP
jgi:hypothetical protein